MVFLAISRIATGVFALMGFAIGGYEIFKGISAGPYDFVGGFLWGVFYLVLTALHHKQQEKEQRLYNQGSVYSS